MRSFLSPYRRPVTLETGVAPRPRGALWRAALLGEQFILSRALLHFERIARPPGAYDARARAAVALAAKARSPFNEPGFYLDWGPSSIACWSWDKAYLRGLGLTKEAWVIPAPVLDAAQPPGYQLKKRADGWEGRIFDAQGALAATRFWRDRPSLEQEEAFKRTGQPRSDGVSRGRDLSWWERARIALRRRIDPIKAAPIAIVLLGAPFAYLSGAYIALVAQETALEASLAELQGRSASQFAALERFRSETARIDAIRSRLEFPDPMRAVVDLGEAVSGFDGRVDYFRVDKDGVTARFSAPSTAAPAGIASDLEFTPSLAGVQLERGAQGRDWSIEAAVTDADPGGGDDDAG